jgi:hypothetical protein
MTQANMWFGLVYKKLFYMCFSALVCAAGWVAISYVACALLSGDRYCQSLSFYIKLEGFSFSTRVVNLFWATNHLLRGFSLEDRPNI